jgi:hypothetical protein
VTDCGPSPVAFLYNDCPTAELATICAVSNSSLKCLRSVFGSIFKTRAIACSGVPKAMALTLARLSGVGL